MIDKEVLNMVLPCSFITSSNSIEHKLIFFDRYYVTYKSCYTSVTRLYSLKLNLLILY